MLSGWSSTISQGRAIEVLVFSDNLTNDEKRVRGAKKLLNSFFIDVKLGGVTYKTDNLGWWYEQYPSRRADAREPMILNGMMSALILIHKFFEYTKDKEAKFLFDKGIAALEIYLPKYNDKGNSNYDIIGNSAKPHYHELHIKYLKALYEITGKDSFKKYQDLWTKWKKD